MTRGGNRKGGTSSEDRGEGKTDEGGVAGEEGMEDTGGRQGEGTGRGNMTRVRGWGAEGGSKVK